MHRTEGPDYVYDSSGLKRQFGNGPPGTRVTAGWLNAVQEEICGVIEGAGLEVNEVYDDDHDQLFTAVRMIGEYVGIAANSHWLIYGDVAPIGWTIRTNLDDSAVFITKGFAAGGVPGGAAHPTGVWQQPGHVLAVGEMPSHVHAYDMRNDLYVGAGRQMRPPVLSGVGTSSSSVGGGLAHDHGNLWRPAAGCFIVCTKDPI